MLKFSRFMRLGLILRRCNQDELVKKFYFGRFCKKFEIKACEARGMKRTYRTLTDEGRSVTLISDFL